jgi:hypothetical protein
MAAKKISAMKAASVSISQSYQLLAIESVSRSMSYQRQRYV